MTFFNFVHHYCSPNAGATPISTHVRRYSFVTLLITLFAANLHARQDNLIEQAQSWQSASYDTVRQQVLSIAVDLDTDETSRIALDALWSEQREPLSTTIDLLDHISTSLPLLAPETQALVDEIASPRTTTNSIASNGVMQVSNETIRANLQVLYGRWYCQNEFYDEAVTMLADLEPSDVLVPSALLFYRSVANQQVLQLDVAGDSVRQLLENRESIPVRYRRLGEMIEADLARFEDGSLEEVERLMRDIRRRQSLHRSGQVVLSQEGDVVSILDDIIEELESQQNQSQSSNGSNPQPGGRPMDSSRAAGGRGEGAVERRFSDQSTPWGNIDPQERSAALAELAKDLPAHYRTVIEEYFRKLAEDDK